MRSRNSQSALLFLLFFLWNDFSRNDFASAVETIRTNMVAPVARPGGHIG